jgi:hypothetical protein
MRIGVHTGRVAAGLIGSKLVRYDIFGEGVIIAHQTSMQGVPGKVCVSRETQRTLMSLPEVAAEYSFEEYKSVNVPELSSQMPAFIVEKRQVDSFERSEGREHSSYGMETDGDIEEESDPDASSGRQITEKLIPPPEVDADRKAKVAAARALKREKAEGDLQKRRPEGRV